MGRGKQDRRKKIIQNNKRINCHTYQPKAKEVHIHHHHNTFKKGKFKKKYVKKSQKKKKKNTLRELNLNLPKPQTLRQSYSANAHAEEVIVIDNVHAKEAKEVVMKDETTRDAKEVAMTDETTRDDDHDDVCEHKSMRSMKRISEAEYLG
eukprot:489663_1